ncbi:MAG: T9SS type A sorting domain-containing protein, partial [Bacteroidota bacterium]
TVTLTATDASNNAASCTATITVLDEVAPTANCQDHTIYLNGNGEATLTVEAINADSYDACGISTMSLSQTAFDCSQLGMHLVTLTLTDTNGNSSSCNATITVEDNTAPIPACTDHTIVFNGEDQLSVSITQLYDATNSTDNCSTIHLIAPTQDQVIACNQLGSTIPVTVSVNDGNGNDAHCIANIYVSGLPCNWTNTYGLDCNGSNDANFDSNSEVFTLNSDNCVPGYPYTSDVISMAYTELCGDGYIKAYVDNIDGNGFAGVMLRNSLDPGALGVSLSTNTVNKVRKSVRVVDGYPAWPQDITSYDKFWLMIERTGTTIRAYASADDVFYTPYIYQTILLDDCLVAGLFVYNEKAGSITTAEFSNVEVADSSGNPSPETQNPQSVTQNPKPKTLKLFPNPSTDLVTLLYPSTTDAQPQLTVFNHLGQAILRKQLDHSGQLQLDVSRWAAGAYVVRVQMGERVVTERLVVQQR